MVKVHFPSLPIYEQQVLFISFPFPFSHFRCSCSQKSHSKKVELFGWEFVLFYYLKKLHFSHLLKGEMKKQILPLSKSSFVWLQSISNTQSIQSLRNSSSLVNVCILNLFTHVSVSTQFKNTSIVLLSLRPVCILFAVQKKN